MRYLKGKMYKKLVYRKSNNLILLQGYYNVNWVRDVDTTLQQKVSLYAKWFYWILSEFTSCSEWGPVKK
jgi:hypothetical protein